MKPHDRLARTIALGRRRYILFFGVLGWGVASAVLFTLLMIFRMEHLTPLQIALPFVLFPLGGYFWGAFMWAWLKKRHDTSSGPGSA